MIDALKTFYPLALLLENLDLVKSSYFYHRSQAKLPDKYADLRVMLKDIFIESRRTYGYRRMHDVLKSKILLFPRKLLDGL